jgi:dethiobiotin synthase
MHKCPGLFITGTDTGIGKTYVSKILADSMSLIRSTTYMKPVQTGCTRDESGRHQAPDYDEVMAGSAKVNGIYERHVPYRFEPACSPHLAAALAGVTISLSHIRECYAAIAAGMDLVIVEGAGGVLTPLSETSFMIDLIVHLDLPAVVVTSPRLGTLNHTFLTLRVLRESGVRIGGVVMNCPAQEPPSYIHVENLRMIKTHIHPVPFLELPFGTGDETMIKEFRDALCNQL